MVGKPAFVKEVIYEDLKAFYNIWQKANDPKIQKMVGEFFSYIANFESKQPLTYRARENARVSSVEILGRLPFSKVLFP